jgi:hypothetical protein
LGGVVGGTIGAAITDGLKSVDSRRREDVQQLALFFRTAWKRPGSAVRLKPPGV